MKEKSNLSTAKYDMVVGITEEAINAQMASYLRWNDGPAVVQWYSQQSPNAPYKLMDPIEDLGIDIFDIPTGGEVPGPLTAENCYFVAAIRAKLGWPEENGEDAPDLLNLDRGINAVTFKMFFSEFQMVFLEFGRRGPSWTNIAQKPDQPFEFDYVVDLKFGSAEFDALTPEQRQQLNNLNPSSAWSVQQLYLDLTTAALLRSPSFNSGAMGTIIQNFVNSSTWNKMVNGQRLVLANTVRKINAAPINKPSMAPTSIQLGVSGFIEATGQHNNKSPLTTLNYLMMTDQDAMPPGQFGGFDWNWVEEKDRSNANGCMAIKRDKFVQFLRDMLCGTGSSMGPINDICFLPSTTASISHLGIAKLGSGISIDPSHISSMTIQPSGAEVLYLKYEKQSQSEDDNWSTAEVENELKYTLVFKVNLVGNEIRMSIDSQIYSRIKADIFNTGGSSGIIGGYTMNPVYVIGVQPDGRLFASLKKGSDTLTPKDKTVSSSILGGLEGSAGMLEKESASFDSFAKNQLQAFNNDINSFLQHNGQLFIFPGGKTFTFKSPSFSEHQDLIAALTYNTV
ncbi:MAG: hypothetical protein IPM36_20350 [Lewinellaceae bacterium]|nr:hypothetical protein [Lewinellaceae bacterium]